MLHLHCLFNWNFLFLFVYQIPVTHASVDFSYLLMYLCVCVYLCLIPKPRLNETVTDIPSPRAYLKTIIFFFEKVTLRIAIFEKVPCYENFNRLATTLWRPYFINSYFKNGVEVIWLFSTVLLLTYNNHN